MRADVSNSDRRREETVTTKAAVMITAELYRARDAMRRFWKAEFWTQVEKYRPCFDLAMAGGKSFIQAGMEIVEVCELEGMEAALILAIAVELTDPTPEAERKL
jgi:hypothetical protein